MPSPMTRTVDASPRNFPIAETGASQFTLRGIPLLKQGSTNYPLATAENLWLMAKVYASGGENALHTHAVEDHAFIVLQGKATFEFDGGVTREVSPFDGVMVPKGTLYRFVADEAENLVMIRVGGCQRETSGIEKLFLGMPRELATTVFNHDGAMKTNRSGDAKKEDAAPVALEGATFPPPR